MYNHRGKNTSSDSAQPTNPNVDTDVLRAEMPVGSGSVTHKKNQH